MWGLAWIRFKRNKVALAGLFIVGYIAFMGIFASFIAPYDPHNPYTIVNGIEALQAAAAPSWAHPFGTDLIGRDVFSWVVYGAQAALEVGFGAAAITMAISILFGVVSGYYGGYIDEVLMRITEIFLVLPFLLILLVLAQISNTLGIGGFSGLGAVIVIIGVLSWSGNARIIRGEVLSVRESEFITAARCIGAGSRRILFRHILPNVLYLVIVLATLSVAGAILVEAAISYLGFGAPGSVTWGQIMENAPSYLAEGCWWMLVFPGIFITLLVLGFYLVGNGLRDALDPRLRE
jgi:ABC-type dipeptide/oligopeptide/nickel transport system permease subunit